LKIYGKDANLNQCPFHIAEDNFFFNPKTNKWIKPMEGIFEILAQKANFTLIYSPKFYYFEGDEKIMVNISYDHSNNFISIGNIFHADKEVEVDQRVTFYDSFFAFIIPPSELFTPYEKLYLPFDIDTWQFLLITFGCSFVIIFIANLMPKVIQIVIYGRNIQSPALNVISIFFGVAMFKLPSGNFARIILMTFILFCLVIRTAYQGVKFEMLNSDMRRPHAKTMQELADKNFTFGVYGNDETLNQHSEVLAYLLGLNFE
jgi:hypothetical protein